MTSCENFQSFLLVIRGKGGISGEKGEGRGGEGRGGEGRGWGGEGRGVERGRR